MDQDQMTLEHDPTVLEALQRYFSKPGEDSHPVEAGSINLPHSTDSKLLPAALLCFLLGQFLIEFLRQALGVLGLGLVVAGFILALTAFLRQEKAPYENPRKESAQFQVNQVGVRMVWILAAFVMAVTASLFYRQGSLSMMAGLLWLASIFAIVSSCLGVQCGRSTFHI